MKKIVFILLAFAFSSAQAQFKANWESLNKRETPSWWSDAKFGIFIHWGLYSVPAYAPVNEVEGVYEKYAEHYYNRLLTGNKLFTDFHKKYYGENFKYADFAPLFKVEHFNPAEWADLFKEAGAKYVVLTSKHHDGFCLWPSTHSPHWNSVVMGPHLDIIDTLSTAVRDAGLRFGLYYSLLEWAHPLYSKPTIEKWVDRHMIPQMKELVNTYKPEIIFSDGEWDYDSKTLKSEEFLAWLYNESPVKNSVVANDRWGKETRSKYGDYYTTEYDLVHSSEGIGDKADHPWEESRGIGTSYGYNRFETSAHYLSSKQLIDILIDKVSNGGNFLLNVGPDASGMIPVVMQERLLDIGKWIKINGEAIYSSRPWRNTNKPEGGNIAFTQREENLYVILKEWQQNPIIIPGLEQAGKVELLGYTGTINSSLQNGILTIVPPVLTIDEYPSQHAWVYKISGFKDSSKPISLQPGELWPDNNGVHINAHGGGILYDDKSKTYYWFGEHKTEGEKGNFANVGVHCYSSKDLYKWKDEGVTLAVMPEGSGSDIEKGSILERPKVIFNKKTGKYVMWFHLEPKGQGYLGAKSGIAVSDKPTGPYIFKEAVRPNAGYWPIDYPNHLKSTTSKAKGMHFSGGDLPESTESLNLVGRDFASGQMARDMNLFVDDDGKAYHIYSSEENSTLHIALLNDEYTGYSGKYKRLFPDRFMEAPAMFKRNGKYYLIMSGCTGWAPNAGRSAVANSIFGEWKELGNPFVGEGSDLSFHSQSTFVLPFQGKDQYIYMGDRWTPKNAIDGRYIWLPIQFKDNKIVVEWKDE